MPGLPPASEPARAPAFFFSSRRRHTRYIVDWSSDVCSSDLEDSAHKAKDDGRIYMAQQYIVLISNVNAEVHRIRARFKREAIASLRKETKQLKDEARAKQERSEERRVGKE